MKSNFLTGYRCNLAFFIIEFIAIVVIGLIFDRIVAYVFFTFSIVLAICVAILWRGNKKKLLSEKAHKIFQCISFVIMSGFASVTLNSAQVFIYSMFFACIVGFIFLDASFSRFQLYLSSIALVTVGVVVGVFTGSSQSILEFCFGGVVLFIANWVIISMSNIIMFQYRQMAEQERSLDDLLKVVEAKCDDAQAATRSKTLFLANMSHEIRTPINSIMGMNEMILRESSEKEIVEYAAEQKNAAESLLSLINDILDITKIEEGKVSLVNVEYKMSSLISGLYNLIRFRADAKKLKFEVIADENLPSVLKGDDVRLKQILTNLLTNAVKYTHEGTVTLEVKRLENNDIYFSVRDTGMGIKEENLNTLFDAFARFEEERNRTIEGTGLGLNITVSLLKLFGSELKVNSVYGIGSDFFFTVSQKIIDNTPIGELDLSVKADETKVYKASFIAPEAKILVVDDNEINRKVFTNLLKKTQIQIDEAESGLESLVKTAKTSYDIIFMDHMMPEMDGIEALRILRKSKENLCCNAPVVALTANAVAGAKEQYLSAGFNSYLSKPINTEKLEKLLFDLLDKNLIMIAEDEPVRVLKETAEPTASVELPVVDGVDWNYARLNLKEDELILDTVRMFRASLKSAITELDGYFESIDTEDGCDSYRVKVHSMKSSAALIGIVQLAGMAMELEKAARNRNADIIRALHPVFASRWNSYYEPLGEITGSGEELKKSSDYMDEIVEIFEQIRQGAENMDVDVLDAMSKLLDEYSYESPLSEKVEMVKMWILNFELEKLADCSI